ncbi:MAG: DUF1697 domain-containing protein [Bacteroidota bacterium]
MKFVAFIRNVNLGQPKSPTRAQLEDAFLQAGASTATSFLSNGTLVYSVSRSRLAQKTAARARNFLQNVCGLKEPVFVCSFQHLVDLVDEDPFSHFHDPTITGQAISFFDPPLGTMLTAPIESERNDCTVFRIGEGDALSILREVNGKTGYPTPVLEKVLNSPVTTRSWTTILRMVKKHG